MAKTCTWTTDIDGINWYTECGHTYFPYIKGFQQPNIHDTDLCPWCKNKRIEDESNYLESQEDYDEDDIKEENNMSKYNIEDIKYRIGDKVRTKIHFINDPRKETDAIINGVILEENEIKYKIWMEPDEWEEKGCIGGWGYVGQDDILFKCINKMTKEEMVKFIIENPNVKISHSSFVSDEYIYTKEDGRVYDENNYLFEDWCSARNGIRMRSGGEWEDNWYIKQ